MEQVKELLIENENNKSPVNFSAKLHWLLLLMVLFRISSERLLSLSTMVKVYSFD